MWCFLRRKKSPSPATIASVNNHIINNINHNNNSNNVCNNNTYKGLFQLCIPAEVKLHIFAYLTAGELCNMSEVSKDMRILAMDDMLWMFFVKVMPDTPLFTPPARVCHSAVVYKDKMYIYGGHIPDPLNYIRDVKNDCHAFHFPTRTWSLISPDPSSSSVPSSSSPALPFTASLSSVLSSSSSSSSSPLSLPFPAKTEHTAVVHQGIMYLFGGYSTGTTGYSDVDIYSFDLETKVCGKVAATGHAPTDRSAHTAVVYRDHMYVLGGWDGNVSNNDFHSFHFPTKVWARVSYVGVPPPSVRSHATVVYKDCMLVFGGYGETIQHPTSLYIFHFLESRWEEIDMCPPSSSYSFLSPPLSSSSFLTSPPPALKKEFYGPCGRSRFRMVYHQESLWVFGGWDRQSYFADLWRFRLDTRTWQKVPAEFELQGVGQHSLVVHQSQMYLYGGYCPVAKAPHPHLYAFRLPSLRNAEA